MNMKTISPKLGVGCMVSFLGDSFKSLGLPFLLQETGLSKPNPKFRRILYIFGGLHPKKLKKMSNTIWPIWLFTKSIYLITIRNKKIKLGKFYLCTKFEKNVMKNKKVMILELLRISGKVMKIPPKRLIFPHNSKKNL